MKAHLTEKLLDAQSMAPGERLEIQDDTVEGLSARAYGKADGSTTVTFYWRRFRGGSRKAICLGKRSDVFTLKAAKAAARKRNGELESGKLDTVAKRQVPTLDEAYQTFREHSLVGHVTERSLEGYDKLATHFGDLGRTKINRVRPAAVKSMHASLGETPRTANRVVQLVSRVWEACADDGDTEGRNPCNGVKRFPERARERVLSADELKRLFEALKPEDQAIQDVVTVLLFTGARKSNVCAMRFEDIDGDVWTIPAAQAKGRRAIKVPLVGLVRDIIARRRFEVFEGYVFPARRAGSATPHLRNLQKPWARVCKRAGIEGAVVHDLRRTWASTALASGTAQRTISQGLGHGDLSSIESYAYSSPESVREAAEKVAERFQEVQK